MINSTESAGRTRRRYLKTLAAGGIGVSLAGCQADDGNGDDTDEPPIGNWPPDDDTVTFGFNGPLSGALGPDGQDQELGYDLAITHLNEGGGLVDNFDQLSGDGVLGYQVEATKADTAGDPDTAIDNIDRMIDRDDIQFWTGGMSSTVTIAMQDIAQREKVPFMGGNSTSSSIAGEECSRYYFHPTFHAEIIGMAAGDMLPEFLGEDRSMFHIYMDYSYGQSNRDAATEHLVDDGPWELAGESGIASDETDHSSQISDLEDSDADVLYFSSFGDLAASGLSQMRDAGVLPDQVDVVIPHVSAFTLDPVGSDAEGVYGFEPWNPNVDNEASEIFVDAYRDEFDETPNQSSLHTYESMMVYAAAVEEAETFHPPTVVRTLEEFSWEQAWGPSQFRECDHQVERPWYLVEGVDDETTEELGIRTNVVEATDPLIYECNEYPAEACDMDANEYGDE